MRHRCFYLIACGLLITGCGGPGSGVTQHSPVPAATAQSPSAQPSTPTASATSAPTPTERIQSPTPAATITAEATEASTEPWQTYTNSAGSYSIAIPASWGIVGEPLAAVQFFDQERADLADLDSGEPEFYTGGVEILGLIASAPDPYQAVLPNHSAIVDARPIETPLGGGRVYTLRRDRFKPVNGETVWYAQHVMIPVNDRIYEVWAQVDAVTRGLPAPVLARMLAEFRLTVGE
jgi:hypothetical protein